MLASSRGCDALGFGIMCACEMNVRTRQNRFARGVLRGRGGVGVSRRSQVLCTGVCPSLTHERMM